VSGVWNVCHLARAAPELDAKLTLELHRFLQRFVVMAAIDVTMTISTMAVRSLISQSLHDKGGAGSQKAMPNCRLTLVSNQSTAVRTWPAA
jgi:hypothetical protein